MDALRFSLASDIVELVVLTVDELFLQTLREAVGASRRLWHVPSADKVSDLLVAGGVGILVLDVQALREAAPIHHGDQASISRSGHRGCRQSRGRDRVGASDQRWRRVSVHPQTDVARSGAAVCRCSRQKIRRAAQADGRIGGCDRGSGQSWAADRRRMCGVVRLLGAIWLLRHGSREQSPARPRQRGHAPPAAAPAAESPLLARAGQALAANRLTAPSGDNALELYLKELARNPADADARPDLPKSRSACWRGQKMPCWRSA